MDHEGSKYLAAPSLGTSGKNSHRTKRHLGLAARGKRAEAPKGYLMADGKDSLLRLLNEYPALLEVIKYLAGGFVPILVSAYKFGQYRERLKIDKVNLSELKARVREAQENYEKERLRADEFEALINSQNELVHRYGYTFLKSDPKPRHPLCPSCLAKGVRTGMVVGLKKDSLPSFTCPIPACNVNLVTTMKVMDELMNLDF